MTPCMRKFRRAHSSVMGSVPRDNFIGCHLAVLDTHVCPVARLIMTHKEPQELLATATLPDAFEAIQLGAIRVNNKHSCIL